MKRLMIYSAFAAIAAIRRRTTMLRSHTAATDELRMCRSDAQVVATEPAQRPLRSWSTKLPPRSSRYQSLVIFKDRSNIDRRKRIASKTDTKRSHACLISLRRRQRA